MATTIKEGFQTTQKEEIMIYFTNMKQEIYRTLVSRFSIENVRHILAETERELDELIPDLPFGTGKESPYTRMVIYSGIAVALYLGIIAVSKNKAMARNATYALFTRYIGFSPPVSGKLYGAWMFYKVLQKRLAKEN